MHHWRSCFLLISLGYWKTLNKSNNTLSNSNQYLSFSDPITGKVGETFIAPVWLSSSTNIRAHCWDNRKTFVCSLTNVLNQIVKTNKKKTLKFSAPPKVSILGKPKSSHFTLTENSELALVCLVRNTLTSQKFTTSIHFIPGKRGARTQPLVDQGGRASAWWPGQGPGWPAHLLCCDQGPPGDLCLLGHHRDRSRRQGFSHCQY